MTFLELLIEKMSWYYKNTVLGSSAPIRRGSSSGKKKNYDRYCYGHNYCLQLERCPVSCESPFNLTTRNLEKLIVVETGRPRSTRRALMP